MITDSSHSICFLLVEGTAEGHGHNLLWLWEGGRGGHGHTREEGVAMSIFCSLWVKKEDEAMAPLSPIIWGEEGWPRPYSLSAWRRKEGEATTSIPPSSTIDYTHGHRQQPFYMLLPCRGYSRRSWSPSSLVVGGRQSWLWPHPRGGGGHVNFLFPRGEEGG